MIESLAHRPANVFNIPFGVRFLDALIDALFDGPLSGLIDFAGDPLTLARATLYVPTHRAGRALAAKLAERLSGRTTVLPRILPLGETDALELGWLADPSPGPEIRPGIGEMQRLLLLAELVAQWSRAIDRAALKLETDEAFTAASGGAGIVSLAGDLARLIDTLHLEALPLAELKKLDASDFQEAWRISATFLAIAGEHWPQMLAERGRLDPVDRHGRLMRAYAERLSREGSPHPIIVIGSTGSVAATAELIASIARLKNGAVVLPGLDRGLDARSWSLLAGEAQTPSHPQYALRRLLDRVGIDPEAIEEIGRPPLALAARARLFSEAMRPAETTDAWGALAGTAGASFESFDLDLGFKELSVIEAQDERREALAIALALREALETKELVAALITPDRGLAERVSIELSRWGIAADDSAGMALSRSSAGRLALILAELAGSGLEASNLLALLAHPLTHLGLDRAVLERGRAAIDLALTRGKRLPESLRALGEAVAKAAQERPEHAPRPLARLTAHDFAAASAVVEALDRALAPLIAAAEGDEPHLPELADAHCVTLEAATRHADGSSALSGPDTEALMLFLADLVECREPGPALEGSAYAPALRGLMEGRAVMASSPAHRRVKIWGLLEARLLAADLVVLGGLVEGAWPARIATDPFLNRGLRAQLGLSAPERRIGQMAHDFVAGCGASRCILTRPLKAQGADTIPSRFLQRLEAVVGERRWHEAKSRGALYLGLADMLDEAGATSPVARPAPLVPAADQPRQLSVTSVETLLRDPYSIYARYVLRLDKLDSPGFSFDPRHQGTVWHEAFAAFVRQYPRALPPHPSKALIAIGRELLAPYMEDPQVAGFVWPRFQRVAHWFTEFERSRRPDIEEIIVETSSSLELPLSGDEIFRLTARPDRIERLRNGSLAIVDFKTGTPPRLADVLSGFSPQLTLEAAILRGGGMEGVPPGIIAELCHVALSGGNPAGRKQPVDPKDAALTLDELAEEHLAGLIAVLDDYRQGRRGFASKPFPGQAPAFSDYDHLARFAEWADEGVEDAETE
ncbi:MAG: double-strand break repair protein AddB [Hyphomicrobiales bacterium]|nr:double-strand break repair protein AddB [Hyphomicrobiales bacterium]